MSTKALAALAIMLAVFPVTASAHQLSTYKIGNWYYSISVGSVAEPVIVGEATAVEIIARRCKGAPCPVGTTPSQKSFLSAGAPVLGLDTTLSLEIGTNRTTREVKLEKHDGIVGGYTAVFVPTDATLYTYRILGRIDNVPVDLTFGCRSLDEERLNDTKHMALSYAITRLSEFGAVECPVEKAPLEFPSRDAVDARQDRTTDVLRLAVFGSVALSLVSLGAHIYLWRRGTGVRQG